LFIEEEFMLFFLKELGNKIIKLSQTIDYLSDNSIELRLLKYLKLQYVQQNTKIITLNMSKARIAKEIGTVREVVSRTFKKLENKGIIRNLSNNKIEILIKEYF
ncbi:MAG: winged helix-turn-helix domain-containing protein, partial [Leptotrichiaceae bacterium]|nr:winged helix-turn-helix domain-containing protein [Leptotrichiaceae bacterium]